MESQALRRERSRGKEAILSLELVEDLWIWRYALESRGSLNARTGRRVYEGALVRSGSGFGCLHPWPELGDPTLNECLKDLGEERGMRIVQRTLDCVSVDGRAREEGRSLFQGLKVPPSHATLPFFDEEAIEEAVGRGFTHVKVKCGRDLPKELAEVRRLICRGPELCWRLDFNETGEAGELIRLFKDWSVEEKGAVDFLEDPVPYRGGSWSKVREATGLALANDHDMENDLGDSEVIVVKPAVNQMPDDLSRVVVTSYLDHPLGQTFAAFEAAQGGVRKVSGLQTHGIFEKTIFSEELGPVQPDLQVPNGFGLGFGEILEKLPWVKLV